MELNNTDLILDANLRAYYRMESGALTTDDSGNSRTLTNSGSVAEALAKWGNGGDFGASNSSKFLYRNANIWSGNQIANLSMGGWFKVRTEPGTGVVFNLLDTETTTLSNNASYMGGTLYYLDSSGTKRVGSRFYRSGGSGTDQVNYDVELGTDEFHLLGITITSSTTLKLYLDGVLVDTQVHTGSMRSPGDAINYQNCIGRYHANTATQYASVYADDVFFIEKTLSSSEWLELYRTGVNKFNPILFGGGRGFTLG